MDINNRICKLLLIQDCVIIPNLGGFITNYRPAQIAFQEDKFVPPSREVVFNAKLSKNDGLLVNFMAEETGCSYFEALKQVRLFSEECLSSLDKGEKVYFNQIGFLFQDREQNIQFEPEKIVNFLPDAYGLSAFKFNEIGQMMHSGRVHSKDKKTTHAVIHRGSWKWVAAGLLIAAGVSAFPIYSCYNSNFELSSLVPANLFKSADTLKGRDVSKDKVAPFLSKKNNERTKVSASVASMTNPEDGKALYGKGLPSDQREEKSEVKAEIETSSKEKHTEISHSQNAEKTVKSAASVKEDAKKQMSRIKGKSKHSSDKLLDATTLSQQEGQPVSHADGTTKVKEARLNRKGNLTHIVKPGQRYHLIVGCFKNVAYARYYKKLLLKYGYSPKIYPKDRTTSYYRISLNSYKNAKMANNAMRSYRKRMPKGIAWIMTR